LAIGENVTKTKHTKTNDSVESLKEASLRGLDLSKIDLMAIIQLTEQVKTSIQKKDAPMDSIVVGVLISTIVKATFDCIPKTIDAHFETMNEASNGMVLLSVGSILQEFGKQIEFETGKQLVQENKIRESLERGEIPKGVTAIKGGLNGNEK
jgi:hypothetical protein